MTRTPVEGGASDWPANVSVAASEAVVPQLSPLFQAILDAPAAMGGHSLMQADPSSPPLAGDRCRARRVGRVRPNEPPPAPNRIRPRA